MNVLGQIVFPTDLPGALRKATTLFQKVEQVLSRRSYRGEATWDPASIADGDKTSTTVTVPDARVGDAVLVLPPYDLQELCYCGYVSADNTVEIVLNNNTGAAVDLAEGAWRVIVEKW